MLPRGGGPVDESSRGGAGARSPRRWDGLVRRTRPPPPRDGAPVASEVPRSSPLRAALRAFARRGRVVPDPRSRRRRTDVGCPGVRVPTFEALRVAQAGRRRRRVDPAHFPALPTRTDPSASSALSSGLRLVFERGGPATGRGWRHEDRLPLDADDRGAPGGEGQGGGPTSAGVDGGRGPCASSSPALPRPRPGVTGCPSRQPAVRSIHRPSQSYLPRGRRLLWLQPAVVSNQLKNVAPRGAYAYEPKRQRARDGLSEAGLGPRRFLMSSRQGECPSRLDLF